MFKISKFIIFSLMCTVSFDLTSAQPKALDFKKALKDLLERRRLAKDEEQMDAMARSLSKVCCYPIFICFFAYFALLLTKTTYKYITLQLNKQYTVFL